MIPQPKDPAQYTDPELIEAVATEVRGWRRVEKGNKQWWELPKGKFYELPYFDPLTDWNHTMEVWQSLIDRKLAPGIDQTDDHATVIIGRLDSLGCLDVFVHVEHANAQRAVCIAALRAVRSAK